MNRCEYLPKFRRQICILLHKLPAGGQFAQRHFPRPGAAGVVPGGADKSLSISTNRGITPGAGRRIPGGADKSLLISTCRGIYLDVGQRLPGGYVSAIKHHPHNAIRYVCRKGVLVIFIC